MDHLVPALIVLGSSLLGLIWIVVAERPTRSRPRHGETSLPHSLHH